MSSPVPSWPDPRTAPSAAASLSSHGPFGADPRRGNLATIVHALPVLLGLTLARGGLLLVILFGTLFAVAVGTLFAANVLLG